MKTAQSCLGCLILFAALGLPQRLLAQDSCILLPIAEMEERLAGDFTIFRFPDARFMDDIPKRVILKYPDGKRMQVKWKRAPKGGQAGNNAPRYEIAAYEIQKRFLDENDYVVPPTMGNSLPLEEYLKLEKTVIEIQPTFKGANDVFFILQYWLENVDIKKVYDKERFDRDPVYARHLANMNILSYLIHRNDAHDIGNFLISTDPDNPRVFTHDNGIAFGSAEIRRGNEWREIQVKILPEDTIERLRNIDLAAWHNQLGVVAEYQIQDGQLVAVPRSTNLNPKEGIRVTDEVVQLGLTEKEIQDIHKRQQDLLARIDAGKIKTFAPLTKK